MTLFKRGMIFVTFFGSCLSLGLLVAALGTKYWVVAHAKRVTNPEESDGKINFGLFQGRKELNVAYGWRTYQIDSAVSLRVKVLIKSVCGKYPNQYPGSALRLWLSLAPSKAVQVMKQVKGW
uniref:Uncharacterized protein n=1 Tax=Timema bartmani TaxID=61472 RepID=A0A7R9ER63_9NEOP|nr:unnamed protein product [Timema bartmani]